MNWSVGFVGLRIDGRPKSVLWRSLPINCRPCPSSSTVEPRLIVTRLNQIETAPIIVRLQTLGVFELVGEDSSLLICSEWLVRVRVRLPNHAVVSLILDRALRPNCRALVQRRLRALAIGCELSRSLIAIWFLNPHSRIVDLLRLHLCQVLLYPPTTHAPILKLLHKSVLVFSSTAGA